ncbi:hypothetical protein ETD83_22665 [Actinomadura soli]|uniref:Uncharacterized protein n=1 Tax=Actinomadura soli TaxID=2508997 RepID=A0A5C4JA26_9ACTN|nr:protein DpdD [Actinomadura soli]TMQ95293.1 hypothetical protein ETD83_22665 [Actinomadura soli]
MSDDATLQDILRAAMGDTRRFQALKERVEVLFDTQFSTWAAGKIDWLIVPLERTPAGFYLISKNREGQRHGQEVLEAFLGPAFAIIEPAALSPAAYDADHALDTAGITRLSLVRRTQAAPTKMLARLEDAIAALGTKEVRARPTRPSHTELLRDFRLSLLSENGDAAQTALDSLRLTGRLSAENLRFLAVELLGSLQRWEELRRLPYLQDMLRARRPRAVNEILLAMVWHTDVVSRCAAGQSASSIYQEQELHSRYGTLLNAIDVPASGEARSLTAVVARAQGDSGRLARLLSAPGTTSADRERLQRLAEQGETPALSQSQPPASIEDLYDQGQYGAVVQAFIDSPAPADADWAVQAVLDTQEAAEAAAVLAVVKGFIDEQELVPQRRLRRDITDLHRMVDGSCHSWTEWCSKVGKDLPWADAAQILRAQRHRWADLRALSAAEITTAADGILGAWTGTNQNQIIAALDVLCEESANAAESRRGDDFSSAVLLVLEEQHNLSSPVRDAYLFLIKKLLESGLEEDRYRKTLNHALSLWRKISSPAAIDWAISLLDILLEAPSPSPDGRSAAIAEVLGKSRDFWQRLSPRQHSELTDLAKEVGLGDQFPQEAPDDTDTVWNRLNGTTIGIYSLLPKAEATLRNRLSLLCTPRAVVGNSDEVSTAALRALATRADYLIVDTKHATHAATAAIDAARPRDRQILPQGQGVSGFMQALEQHLSGTGA